MKGWWVPLALLLGMYLAVKITSWVNWFTFGENRQRREKNLSAGKPASPHVEKGEGESGDSHHS